MKSPLELLSFGNVFSFLDATSTLIVIRTEFTEDRQFDMYLDQLQHTSCKVLHFTIGMSPWNVNHWRDLYLLALLVRHELMCGLRVHLFGYSIGGKFAARLAQMIPEIASIFLLDPVDGGLPLLSDQIPFLPVFMEIGSPMIEVPCWLIETELGSACNNLGLPCVPVGLGSGHFRAHIAQEYLRFYFLEDVGHLQLIEDNPYDPDYLVQLTNSLCASGKKTPQEIEAELIQIFKEYCINCIY